MEFFNKIRDQFLNFKFKESLENILSSLKFEALSKLQQDEIFEILDSLFSDAENRSKFFAEFSGIGEFFFEKENYSKSLRIFEGLLPVSSNNDIERALFYIFINAAKIGKLDLSLTAAKRLLKLRFRMKYLERGLELIELIKSFGLGDDLVNEYTVKFALLKKDIKTFNRVFPKLNLEQNSVKYWEYCLETQEETKWDESDWNISKHYMRLNILFRVNWLMRENIEDSTQRKELVNLIYQYKIRYPKELFIYPILLQYSIFYKRINLEKSVTSYFTRNPKKFSKNKLVREQILELLKGPRIYLKKEEVLKPDEKNDVRSLTGLTLISPFKDSESAEFEALSQKAMLKVIDILEDETLLGHYQDLVACFGELNFYDVVFFILQKYQDLQGPEIKLKDFLNVEYLRITFLIKDASFHEAILAADDVIFYRPLYLKEKLAFLYLKAEALLGIGEFNKAEEIYILISKHFPNFRLVKERLKEIENFK